jgi:phosphatidylglycerol---prolipoprotein diacylglyceryl transferase
LRKRYGDNVSLDERWWIIAAAMAGAALGSRLLGLLENPLVIVRSGQLGGKTIVGGLLGGWVAVEWIKKRVGVSERTGDLFAIPLAVGIAIGRIGCFLAGLPDHTYGIETRLPWGVDFGDRIMRHPTQLYEILFLLLVIPILAGFMRREHRRGDIFRGFIVAYLGWRFTIDFLKPDFRHAGLSVIQWVCLAFLLSCIASWVLALRRPHPTGHKVEIA